MSRSITALCFVGLISAGLALAQGQDSNPYSPSSPAGTANTPAQAQPSNPYSPGGPPGAANAGNRGNQGQYGAVGESTPYSGIDPYAGRNQRGNPYSRPYGNQPNRRYGDANPYSAANPYGTYGRYRENYGRYGSGAPYAGSTPYTGYARNPRFDAYAGYNPYGEERWYDNSWYQDGTTEVDDAYGDIYDFYGGGYGDDYFGAGIGGGQIYQRRDFDGIGGDYEGYGTRFPDVQPGIREQTGLSDYGVVEEEGGGRFDYYSDQWDVD